MSLNSRAVCTGKVLSKWNINQQKKLDACRNNIFQSSSVNVLFLQNFQIYQPTTVTTLLTRTWRPQHSTKHPQTKGTPPRPFLSAGPTSALPKANGNGNGWSCEWYYKLHIDHQWWSKYIWLNACQKNGPISLGITCKPSLRRFVQNRLNSHHTVSHGLVHFNS